MDGFDELTLDFFNYVCSFYGIKQNDLHAIYLFFTSLPDIDISIRKSGNKLELLGKYKGYENFSVWKDNIYSLGEENTRIKTFCEINFTPKELHNCFEYRDIEIPTSALEESVRDIPCLYQRRIRDARTKSIININISFLHFPKSKI